MAACQLLLLFAAFVIVARGANKWQMDVWSQSASRGEASSSASKATYVLSDEDRALDLGTLYGTLRRDETLHARSSGGTKRVAQFILTSPSGKRLGGAEKPNLADLASAPVPDSAQEPSQTTGYPSALIGDACNEETTCQVASSECVEGECRCLTNHIAFGNAACLRRANFLGDTCYLTQQCTHLHNVSLCYQGRCLCEPIYYVAARPCTSTFDYDAIGQGGSDSTSTGPATPTCSRKAKVGQACCDHNQCRYNVWNSHCGASGTCQCDSGYVNIGNEMCVRFATALGDACSVSAQCAQIANSECSHNGTCGCQGDAFTPRFLTTRTRRQQTTSNNYCLPIRRLLQSCEDNRQCRGFHPQAECRHSLCQCPSVGFWRLDDALCLPMAAQLQDRCSVDAQCRNIGTPCLNGTCQHEIVETPQAQINALLAEISTLGGDETCIASKQCVTDNAICDPISDRCQCNAATHCQVGDACEALATIGAGCTSDCQCNAVRASCIGTPATCSCASTQHHDILTDTCVDVTTTIGGACVVSGQCTVANTVCNSTSQTCVCNPNGFAVNAANTVCLATVRVGFACTEAAQCSTPDALCTPAPGLCSCPTGFVFSALVNQCLVIVTVAGMECTDAIQCQVVGTFTQHNDCIDTDASVAGARVCALVTTA